MALPVPLLAETSSAWVQEAVRRWPELLVDHDNCEKKAASTALALMFAYPEDRKLVQRLSRLAREELRHFEQVDRLMQSLGVAFSRQKPGRYAQGLRAELASAEPARKLDLLLMGALIEARSCERFRKLADPAAGLPEALAVLYRGLEASEARHFELYLELAARESERTGLDGQGRLTVLAQIEASLATQPDALFRFHSGTPVPASTLNA